MARLNVEGMDEVLDQMTRMGQLSGRVANKMLERGATEMVKAWKHGIELFRHVDKGTMLKSVEPTRIRRRNGVKSVDVYPQGDDTTQKTPRRNAEKAFVLHYGRKNMSGSHFVDKVVADGEPKANAAMEARWDEFIEKGR